MIMPDHRKTVSIILSRMGKDGSEKSGEMMPEEEMGADSTLKAIAEDMMMAFQSKSAHDLMVAMKAFMREIQNQDMEQDENMG